MQSRSAIYGGRRQGYVDEQLGDAHYVAIRFRPGGLSPFIPMPLTDLADQIVDLDLIWGPEVRRWEDHCAQTLCPDTRLHQLSKWAVGHSPSRNMGQLAADFGYIESDPWGQYARFKDPDGNGLVLRQQSPAA